MKKITGLLLLGYVLLNPFCVKAQTYAESALLFSRINPGGSARIQGMGGAQVSLGGDYSSAFSNPAGLGMYNRSEFTFTPGFLSSTTSSEYLGNTMPGSQSKLIIPGISFVFHSDKNAGKFLGGTFGISVNRVNDFNRTVNYSSGKTVAPNSIIDYFIGDANGFDASQFDQGGYQYNRPTGLAYDNYLFNAASANPNETHYVSDVPGNPLQKETIQTTGSQYQVSVAYGINLSDKVFLGGGVGFTSIDYTSTKTYNEKFQKNTPQDTVLNSIDLAERLRSSGSGINFTLGGIYKPVDFFQAGFSVATPTFYVLNDTYSASMTTDWQNFPYGQANYTALKQSQPISTDQVLTTYSLDTPWRLSGGLTFFVLKHGLVTADVEYLAYGSNHYSSQTGDDFSSDNSDIKSAFRSVFNYRIGAEYRWKKYRLRGGYSLMPDGYKAAQNNVDAAIQAVSGGVGFRATKFYIDLTGVVRSGNIPYQPYTSAPGVTIQNTATTVMLTVGFPF